MVATALLTDILRPVVTRDGTEVYTTDDTQYRNKFPNGPTTLRGTEEAAMLERTDS
jgi:hypothetical protein